jgi:hypothetical protein
MTNIFAAPLFVPHKKRIPSGVDFVNLNFGWKVFGPIFGKFLVP